MARLLHSSSIRSIGRSASSTLTTAPRAALARYFACSIEEAWRIGRVVDIGIGLAVWLLPQPAAIEQCEVAEKRARLREIHPLCGRKERRAA